MNFLSILTFVHVAISLVAITLGIPAIQSIFANKNRTKVVFMYFFFTAVTTLSGFAFPITRFTPGIAFGILTLILLAVAARAVRRASHNSHWHFAYLLTVLGTLYLNCVVLIVQSFQKIGFLHAMAPTQSELPFFIAQSSLVVAMFVIAWRGIVAMRLPKTFLID